MQTAAKNSKSPTFVQQLARNLCDAVTRKQTDENALHAAERLLLDTVGCGLGASREAPVIAARKWAALSQGTPGARIVGTRDSSSVAGAALANSTAMRHLDMNDCDWSNSPAHPSDNIGACLAVAEATGASSHDLLVAILVGFEVQMRSTEFTKVSFFRTTGWDLTTFLTISTAAAAGVLLKLDAERMAHALAIAACYPTLGELRVGQISTMKAMSAGLSASRGIESAYLASFGATGPLEIFEGRRGMEKLMLGESDWALFTGPVKEWRLPRTCLKQYPAAYIIHAGIDAALALKREHALSADKIAEVTVAGFDWLIEDMVHGMGGTSRYEIDRRETADHSLPYCVAVSLVDGEYTPAQLAAQRWRDDDVKAMLAKVKCVHDESLDGGFPARRPVRVTVALADGTRHTKEVIYPKGDPRNPLTDEDLAKKFRMLSGVVLSADKQERAIRIALNLRRHSVAELIDACTP